MSGTNQYRVWLEHDRGADCHVIEAPDRDEACYRALAATTEANAHVVRVEGAGQ